MKIEPKGHYRSCCGIDSRRKQLLVVGARCQTAGLEAESKTLKVAERKRKWSQQKHIQFYTSGKRSHNRPNKDRIVFHIKWSSHQGAAFIVGETAPL